ncbi:MAG TPA: flagellar basal-body MS-ring/collar protein FliF [Syntrophomonadaceae bacterium]|nr:flagellar basal-body MS-ring/collar protein FliF [Syntrophomonadaceae bacterium]
MNRLKQWGSTLRDAWNKLSLNQRVLFAGAALLIGLAVVVLSAGNGVSYDTLYTIQNDKDVAAVVAKLDEYKVPYKLQDAGGNGTTIQVPIEQKDKTRIRLAGDDLPSSQSGLELFQTTNFGETESDKKVKYQMALQGELARTIQALDEVKAAKINLAIPEPTLFSEKEQPSKASVVINTKDGKTLKTQEVQAIVNLVANSVNGLGKENVVIVDQNGNLLSDSLPSEGAASGGQVQMQMALKREFEKEKQLAIQSMLDKTLGADNAVVRVNAEINFDNTEQKSEQYVNDKDGAHVRSESVVKESSTNTDPGATGTPGTASNVPQYSQSTSSGGTSSDDKSSKQTNYEISKTETDTKMAPGDVKYDYLTVSVIVNNKAIKDVNLGATDAEKAAAIRNMVATATGLRENRQNENVNLNNNISVAFMDFAPQAEPDTQTKASLLDKILASPLTPGLMVLIALTIIAVVAMSKRKANMPEVAVDTGGFDIEVDEEINIEDLFERNLTPEEKERQKIKEEIEKLVETDPESAAQVLKTWLVEDSR